MGKMRIVKEVTFGQHSSLHFYCDNCEKTCVINSKPHNVGKDINKEIVWGCLSTGIGHNQAEEIFGLLDVPFMHTKTFAKKTSEVKKVWTEHLSEATCAAGEEEKRLAIEDN